MADKYGIPPGGNNGTWRAKKWQNVNHTLGWEEMVAAVAMGGWPESQWTTAVAVGAAESGRNPFIYNTYKMGHFGLFQISRSAWPEFFAPGGNGMDWINPIANSAKGYAIYQRQGWGAWEAKTNGLYLGFVGQARAAVASVKAKRARSSLKGDKFYKSLFTERTVDALIQASIGGGQATGGLLDGLADAIGAGANAAADGLVGAGADTVGAVGELADLTGISLMRDAWESLTTPALWMRLAYGTTGVVLVVGGLLLMVRTTPVGSAVKKAASAVPVGRVAAAAKMTTKAG